MQRNLEEALDSRSSEDSRTPRQRQGPGSGLGLSRCSESPNSQFWGDRGSEAGHWGAWTPKMLYKMLHALGYY